MKIKDLELQKLKKQYYEEQQKHTELTDQLQSEVAMLEEHIVKLQKENDQLKTGLEDTQKQLKTTQSMKSLTPQKPYKTPRQDVNLDYKKLSNQKQ